MRHMGLGIVGLGTSIPCTCGLGGQDTGKEELEVSYVDKRHDFSAKFAF